MTIFSWTTNEKLLGTYLLLRLDDESEIVTCGMKIERNFLAIPIINVTHNMWSLL